jgi:hypothetical protein
MRSKNIQVRGCCMGIPFGCGSLLFFGICAGLYLHLLPGFSLLAVSAYVFGALVLGTVTLIVAEWFHEKRELRPSI